ncbi:ATP-binding protein [Streptomyces phaeochromogenes]|uniref:ATP-binding protein n=1 Tax=Streptomyces phaeochromogenes TaxID=1923 RepID=UPI0033CADEC2
MKEVGMASRNEDLDALLEEASPGEAEARRNEDFDALLEESSLGETEASRLRADTPLSSARTARAIAHHSAPVARSSAGSRQIRELSFDTEPSRVVPLARDFIRQALYEWGWLPAATADQRAFAEDALLVGSELVTNAWLHAEGPDALRIRCDSKVLRIEVSDRGTGQPAPRTPNRAGRPGGHGMFIVQRLCTDWGVVRMPGVAGKTVWAELGMP